MELKVSSVETGLVAHRSTPNLMTAAEMRGMDPRLMGGFLTAEGPECLTSFAVPIPILDSSMLKNIMTRDVDIPLSVGDICDRHKIGQADYGQAWSGRDEVISLDGTTCIECDHCSAIQVCPTLAVCTIGGKPSIDRSRCVNCGACVDACVQKCFKGNLGEVRVSIDGRMRVVPIICRNSNREGGATDHVRSQGTHPRQGIRHDWKGRRPNALAMNSADRRRPLRSMATVDILP